MKKLKEAEEAQKRREEEARKIFLEDQKKTLESLKGTSEGTLKIKGGTDFFGIKGSPDVELKLPGKERTEVTTAWKQLHCAASISNFVLEKAKKADIEEVRYLAGQANKAMIGEPIGVQCPEAPPPPQPYGRAELGPSSPVVRFYQALLRATVEQAERVEKSENRIKEATVEKRKAQEQIQRKEQEIIRLKDEIEETKKAAPAPKPESKDTQAKNEIEKKRALAEALEALRMAQDAEAKADEAIHSANKEKADANAKLGQYETMFEQVKTDPGKASELLNKIEK